MNPSGGRDGDEMEANFQGGTVQRGVPLPLPAPAKGSVPAPYSHQLATLGKLDAGADLRPPVSGIVHLPTGAGKTRIGLEFIARTLQREPKHRFVWATDSKLLIQQTMTNAAELAGLFPKGTQIAWYDGRAELLADDDIHVMFITRSQLRDALAWAHDARSAHPWRTRVEAGLPTTLFYDECHQLGATELQKAITRFYKKVVIPLDSRRHRWRVIGLSATPVPTRHAAHTLLQKQLFPLRSDVAGEGESWGMHVFHRVTNAKLIADHVLCPVNMHMDQTGIFDLRPELITRITKDAHISPPGPGARKEDVVEYAMKFNKSVMGHDSVLQFLAERLAKNLPLLGKTVVFVPTIDAANVLVAKLKALPSMSDKVAVVHSRMDALARTNNDTRSRTPEQVLAKFKDRGAAPCILVNVEMLTEGFDDPRVRTIVLAKLTLSTNRFWQMIGRGTRGTQAGGTSDCFIIDPIKLVRLYDYFGGYQPSIGSRPGAAIEDEAEERGEGALDPSVPAISRAPLPSAVKYVVSSEMRRIHASVAAAIDAFLLGERLGEDEALAIARSTQIVSEDGAVVAQPGAASQTTATGSVLLHETLVRIRERLNADLAWLEKYIPNEPNEQLLRHGLRRLDAVEHLKLRTEGEYAQADMDGRLSEHMGRPVVRHDAMPLGMGSANRVEVSPSTLDAALLCSAVGRSDGELVAAEIEVAVRVLGPVTGARDSADLRGLITNSTPSAAAWKAAAARLRTTLGPTARNALLNGLVEVAAADGRMVPAELIITGKIADELGLSPADAER